MVLSMRNRLDVFQYVNNHNLVNEQRCKNIREEKVCGMCKWHEHENFSDGWVCVCNRSDNCADWTEAENTCEQWEAR